MNHIDEGTIHAWLDGALDAERGRVVETHVASCAECSAAVAEARGLIAGASRILMALDDVPANVTPKRAPTPSVTARRRQWRAAPWVTGIAAALVLAIGLTTWNRDGMRMASSEMSAVMRQDSAVPSPEAAQSLADVAPPVAAAAGVRPSVTAPSTANAVAGQRREAAKLEQKSAPQPGADVVTGGGRAAGAPAERDFSGAADSLVLRPQVGRVAARGVATDTTRLRTTSSTRMQLSELVVTAAPSAVDSTTATIAVSRCYRLASAAEERERDAKPLTKRAAEAAAGAAASSRAAKPAAPAPSVQLRDRSDYAGQRPAIVRLDTTRAGVSLRVNDARSSSYLGTWQRVGDSVRVNLFVHGVFTIAAGDSVACP